ncbi:hypothetical protein CEP54_004535 [Fusarium duplospermum]|uniref:Uncharacterized protein n=1 Tax=Fusarium duplospermum TaxID=1325734 RepID=A0A428QHC7_9HYPO|nr:hypothetical protein CEP54_004535 [Fusarium duplospermum]
MYSGEYPSKVMRYSNGEVSEALGYYWYRPEEGGAGYLMRLDHSGQYVMDPETGECFCATEYKTFSVAACNPLLPIMVVDQDPLTDATGGWELLRIFHPRDNRIGLSQVVTLESPMGDGGAPVRYVAGRSPSWMPSLLPRTYRSPSRDPPESRGLGGELPIILGLMALSPRKDASGNESTNQLFLDRNLWRHNEWRYNDAPKGYPDTAQDDPCAFLVKVFLDPQNPATTAENLAWFEWQTPVVRESSTQSSGSR